MRTSKKKRLQAAGWKVGGAKEFLDLPDEEAALVEVRLALAELLRESRVAKMEAGDASVSTDLLLRGLFSLGVDFKVLAKRLARIQSGPFLA